MWSKFWCWLTHGPYRQEPTYHAYRCTCERCGRVWIEEDD